MKKSVLKSSKPGAWIVSPKDKGRKSIKNGNIYLNQNSEFQIELFNPLTNCVLADIRLNGQAISKSGLVINPGQRVYLDCFIDDQRKFIFQTYEVDNTDDVMEAIIKNGLVEVLFYSEKVVNKQNWVNDFYKIHHYHTYYPYQPYQPYPTNPWYTTCNVGTSRGSSNYYGSNITTNLSSSNTFSTTSNSSCLYSSNTINFDGLNSCKSIETGRVEKGEQSNQEFLFVDKDFESYCINKVIYTLLPSSQQPIEATIKKESKIDFTEILKSLSKLRDEGILTEDEFINKKKEILNRI